jgi:hypothetical protein
VRVSPLEVVDREVFIEVGDGVNALEFPGPEQAARQAGPHCERDGEPRALAHIGKAHSCIMPVRSTIVKYQEKARPKPG